MDADGDPLSPEVQLLQAFARLQRAIGRARDVQTIGAAETLNRFAGKIEQRTNIAISWPDEIEPLDYYQAKARNERYGVTSVPNRIPCSRGAESA